MISTTDDAKIMEFEFGAFSKNMSKCSVFTLIDFDQKFREIAKFAVFLFTNIYTDNAGSCKESRDPKKINIDLKIGSRN